MSKHHRTGPVGKVARRKPPHVGAVLGYIVGLLVILGLMWLIATQVL